MFGLPLPARVRLVCVTALAALSCWTNRAAADGERSGWRPAAVVESAAKLLHLRRLARTMLHWGRASEDEEPIRLGPACARLFWQRKWRWPEHTAQQKLAGGLQGGPMLSIGVPLRALGRSFSIETRFSSYRYAMADLQSERTMLHELPDPHDQHQSVEGGLYLTLPLSGLF